MKRILSLVLAFTLLLGMLSVVPVSADTIKELKNKVQVGLVYNDFRYSIWNDEIIKIDKYTGTKTDVVIPSVINGYPVTEIGSYSFLNNEKIVSVTIPYGVKSIQNSAFSGCKLLKNISVPNSVESIGYATFEECIALENIKLSNNIKTISDINKAVEYIGKSQAFLFRWV